ncbi:MAG: hypothetical protein HOD11_10730 [Candidatus Marinimicrobia bacterium]|jgi:hypothetical protein|nr:hypothetical protein [Candidatus Neomarinimicrobiota bacterium]MBT5270638.1 hypothetical protein [Candidatus Neomarinimicrobiota bacterium]
MKKNEKQIDAAIQFAIIESEAELIGSVGVDSGQIEIGDVGIVQFRVPTESGDGVYPVWNLGDYIIIETNYQKVNL